MALNPLAIGPTPLAKTGAKSAAELATRAAYVRPLERLAPPAGLSEDARQVFLDIVLACEATHFRASDMPLLAAYDAPFCKSGRRRRTSKRKAM